MRDKRAIYSLFVAHKLKKGVLWDALNLMGLLLA